jgi:TPR repeat protein
MGSVNITRQTVAALLCGAMLATSVQAQTPAAPAAPQSEDTTVSDVVVVGGKVTPNTENPKSATCEFLVATDPFIRAQIVAAGGDPLMGPTIRQPTRWPRNVEFGVEPLSAPGSELPAIGRQFRGISTTAAPTAENPNPTPTRLYQSAEPVRQAFQSPEFEAAQPEGTIDEAIGTCRNAYTTGMGHLGGRFEISYRDTMMPTAFALFDEHRYAESLTYFQKAFKKLPYDLGGDEAALMIGKLYLGAPGVKRNTAEAMKWLERAGGARFNPVTDTPIFDPLEPGRNTAIGEASMILARIYQTGFDGTPKNPAMARKMFERAFNVGHVPAAAILGEIYYFGADTPRDVGKAFQWYRKGATLAHAPAQFALGEMYLSGEAPGGVNTRLGLAWHNEAAKVGHPGSLFVLAVAYEKGEGVPADPQRALGLYKLAALGGNAPARNTIGAYFYEGRIVSKDPVTARKWFEQAAAGGDSDAMYNLGAMMMKGEGGEADRTRAWVWLKLAERSENPHAGAAVRILEARMTDSEKAEAAKLLAPSNS